MLNNQSITPVETEEKHFCAKGLEDSQEHFESKKSMTLEPLTKLSINNLTKTQAEADSIKVTDNGITSSAKVNLPKLKCLLMQINPKCILIKCIEVKHIG